jgi:hypothetical protein
MIARVLSFFRALWPGLGRRTPPPSPPPAPSGEIEIDRPAELAAPWQPSVAHEAAQQIDPPQPPTAPAVELDELLEEEDEDPAEDLENEDEDPLAPDPFVSPIRPQDDTPSAQDLAQRRAEARAAGLSGEHKIYFSDLAGPGTLAEALNQLLKEGLVTAEFREVEGDDAHLIYRPKPE